MKEHTHLSSAIDAIPFNKARYDKNMKEFLADIQILARIVKYTVDEVSDLPIEEIEQCIDGNSIEVGTIPVMPGLTNLGKVESFQTENAVPNEGYVTFDIRFVLNYKASELRIIINIEAQKSTDVDQLKYHLENRIIYYLARLVSSQKEIEFFHSDYDDLKKVYSIWICMDTKKDEDSISKLSFRSENIYGKEQKFSEIDKMCGIVIKIRKSDNVEESKNRLIAMLEDLIRNEEPEVKKQKLIKKYGMIMTVELERSVSEMCNWSDVIEEIAFEKGMKRGMEQGIEKGIEQGIEKGIEQGIEKGIEQGIISAIQLLRELENDTETILSLIMKKYSITREKAEELEQMSR